jgi:eukaryotic-like serine/threonine-protein kinase
MAPARLPAEAAEQLYAPGEAIGHWRQALQLLGDGSRAAAAVAEHLGDALHMNAQYAEAIAAFRSALGEGFGPAPSEPGLEQARLLRKIANVERDQRLYDAALVRYEEAERALPAGEHGAQWVQEWIRLQFDRVQLYYWTAQVDEALELMAALQPEVDRHGSAQQRWHLLSQRLALTMRRQRFAPSAVTEAYLDALQEPAREVMHTSLRPNVLFTSGMFGLLHGRVAEAAESLAEAMQLTERTGDVSLQARCLTYLSIARRQQAATEEVRRLARRSADVAAAAGMPEYAATALANQAWVAWRDGDMAAARAKGEAALKLWAQLPQGHASAIMQWTALWPLIGVALRSGDLPAAVRYARALLAPPQQRLPDALFVPLQQAIDAFEQADRAAAREHLARASAAAIAANAF